MLRRYRKYTLFYKPVIYVYTVSICNNAAKLKTILISEGDSKTPGLLQIPRLIFRKVIFKLSYIASSENFFHSFTNEQNDRYFSKTLPRFFQFK